MWKQGRRARPILAALGAAAFFLIVAGTPARAQLPPNWKSEDIGTAKDYPGSIDVTNGVYTIKGSGNDVWGTADGFRFTYTPLSGDGSISARLLELPSLPGDFASTANAAKAGVMIRETLDPGSSHLATSQLAKRGVEVTFRLATDGDSGYDGAQLFANPPPVWLRVQRVGTTFTAFASSDGQAWTQLGVSHTVAMGASAFAGLVVSSVYDGASTQDPVVGKFDNVSVTTQVLAPGPSGLTVGAGDQSALLSWSAVAGATGYNVYRRLKTDTQVAKVNANPVTETVFRDAGLANGTDYVYAVSSIGANAVESALSPISVATPAALNGFFAADVGIVTAGATILAGDTFTVKGAGRDVGGARDEFRFVFQPVTGDTTLVARLKAGPAPTDASPRAGLMIRESLDPAARQMTVDQVGDSGVEDIFRAMAGSGADTDGSDLFTNALPIFLRLERKGDVIRASASADGKTWQPVGGDHMLSQLSPNLYVGLMVNGHGENTFAEAQFDSVSITH